MWIDLTFICVDTFAVLFLPALYYTLLISKKCDVNHSIIIRDMGINWHKCIRYHAREGKGKRRKGWEGGGEEADVGRMVGIGEGGGNRGGRKGEERKEGEKGGRKEREGKRGKEFKSVSYLVCAQWGICART